MRWLSVCFATATMMLCSTQPVAAQSQSLLTRNVATLEAECSSKQSASCDELSGRYRSGRSGVAQDDEKSARYKLLACEAGDARSCGTYAAHVSTGRSGYPRNDAAIKAKYARLGCVGGDGLSCGLASAIANNTTSYSAAERAEIYRKVCSIGETADCERAAYAEGQRQNWQIAAELARTACARGAQSSCSNVSAYTVRMENAERSQVAQAARSTARPAHTTNQQPVQAREQYAFRRGNQGQDDSRSGTESCSKGNGESGRRYWYYGFDNKRVDGPCI